MQSPHRSRLYLEISSETGLETQAKRLFPKARRGKSVPARAGPVLLALCAAFSPRRERKARVPHLLRELLSQHLVIRPLLLRSLFLRAESLKWNLAQRRLLAFFLQVLGTLQCLAVVLAGIPIRCSDSGLVAAGMSP